MEGGREGERIKNDTNVNDQRFLQSYKVCMKAIIYKDFQVYKTSLTYTRSILVWIPESIVTLITRQQGQGHLSCISCNTLLTVNTKRVSSAIETLSAHRMTGV